MPTKRLPRHVLKLCKHPSCRKTTNESYCDEHGPPKPGPRIRDPFLDSAAWRNLRFVKINETPWCELCLAKNGEHIPAIDVDHIKPRKTHPQLALVLRNLQSLCLACHCVKTRSGL